jgi:hypothetical protein
MQYIHKDMRLGHLLHQIISKFIILKACVVLFLLSTCCAVCWCNIALIWLEWLTPAGNFARFLFAQTLQITGLDLQQLILSTEWEFHWFGGLKTCRNHIKLADGGTLADSFDNNKEIISMRANSFWIHLTSNYQISQIKYYFINSRLRY